MPPTALIRGVGDIASAIAHRFFSAGYNVVVHDVPQPATTRRNMAFADAAFEGVAMLEGVEARRASDVAAIQAFFAQRLVAVYVGPFEPLVALLKPDVLVDARMRKRAVPENQRGLASVTVGLGPNFKVGVTCDVAVETSWEQLGAVIRDGTPRALAGEPRELGGHSRDRYVYAPCSGIFRTDARIGDAVSAGQPIARIDETVLTAPLNGVLRGLTHYGVPVAQHTKVVEIDPRGRAAELTGISERPRRIADGVMAAIGVAPVSDQSE
jgi:xanthine dehydrogenase accessory factor